MFLKSSNVDMVKELSVVSDQLFNQVIQAYKFSKVVVREVFESVTENPREFNCQYKKWPKAVASIPDPVLNPTGIVLPSSTSLKGGSHKSKSNANSAILVISSSL